MARYRIRQLEGPTEKDVIAIDDLYRRARGAHLPQPDMQAVCDAAIEGHLFVIELVGAGAKSDFRGIAGLFPVGECASPGEETRHKVYELAGMALDKELCGYGLQELLIALRLLALARGESANVCVVSSVDANNLRSSANLRACGLTECPSPSWMRSVHRSWCDNDSSVLDLIATPDAVSLLASRLLEPARTWTRVNRQTGALETIDLLIDVRWLRDKVLLGGLARPDSVAWDRLIPEERLLSVGETWVRFQSPESRDAIAALRTGAAASTQASDAA